MSTSLFRQAFDEVVEAVEAHDDWPEGFERWRVLERLRQPDRVIQFTVRWLDDEGQVQATPAWRVQHCNVLGPYKGGLRFADDVEEDTLRFLAFEQCLKNALTGLPLGGGKGGARFTPRAHSDAEVLRFCQAFMDEYVRYGGDDADVPAGDIGTGPREIGWLFGRYAKLTGKHTGMITGKPPELGGIPGRVEATGYGVVRFAQLACERHDFALDGARIAISGAGNVALHAAERALREGARVLTLSHSKGTARFGEDGLEPEQLDPIKRRLADGDSLADAIADIDSASYEADAKPWSVACDIAMPCATQNELDEDDARALVEGGVKLVVEGANMPCTTAAHGVLAEAEACVAPGKAANAGGVVVSGFEMSQNATRAPWTREHTLECLDEVMDRIHARCVEMGETDGRVDYVRGANLAGFARLGRAIVAAGPN